VIEQYFPIVLFFTGRVISKINFSCNFVVYTRNSGLMIKSSKIGSFRIEKPIYIVTLLPKLSTLLNFEYPSGLQTPADKKTCQGA